MRTTSDFFELVFPSNIIVGASSLSAIINLTDRALNNNANLESRFAKRLSLIVILNCD